MSQNNDLVAERVGGNFTEVTDALLPLFCDPDARGSRRWREMFGLELPPRPKPPGPYVSVRVRRRLSSDC